ncbi:class I SAM-dependent methyltransferase [Georgenia sp. H159]|uniref:class I SAM-dependent methyltransferase n=1 Tax=Georgenia sp. H159 TaxID=3076115 RepID=UPI002D768800|nr:class I SAM-dependent methyltransferase [Georgenia sp. H159]
MADRQRWAVELVAASGPETVLEIGCGPGAALALLTEVLPAARVVGVDRSATAVGRAAARLAGVPGRSRVSLQQVAIADLDLPDAGIDVAFGVNVNVFWTSDARHELAALRRVLRPGGVLHLVYEPPGADPWVVGGVEASLARAGWTSSVSRRTAVTVRNAMPARRHLVAVSAVPGA